LPPELLAHLHNDIGFCSAAEGQHDKALTHAQEALKICQQCLDPAHPGIATSLNIIGAIRCAQGRYGEALDYQKDALVLLTQSLGETHPDVANSLIDIGGTYFAQGRYGDALNRHKQALAILQQRLGEDHPDTGSVRILIGATYLKQSNAMQGWKELQQGCKILKARLGGEHPETIASVKLLVALGRQHSGSLIAQQILSDFLAELPPNHPQRAELEALQVGRAGVAAQRPVEAQPAAQKSAAGAAKARKKKR
jgi:tetratricopeptide (TPR) repeat protein